MKIIKEIIKFGKIIDSTVIALYNSLPLLEKYALELRCAIRFNSLNWMAASKFLFLVFLLVFMSCKQIQKIQDTFAPPTPRELYARSFKEGDSAYRQWNNSYNSALRDSLTVILPYVEVGEIIPEIHPRYSFNIHLSEGEKLLVSTTSDSDSVPFFINIHRFENLDSLPSEPLLHEKNYTQLPLELNINKTGNYKVVIQPELFERANFKIELYTQPTLVFPVVNVPDNAIQSFWGAPRSSGKRTHEGVDIFAPKMTPVVAVVEGRTGFVGERGLGGKQVWLRESIFKNSYYYAHLDSIITFSGEKIAVGDTLGFVGNTGNARTTAPHLHFGIYSKEGAIDPLPFIRRNRKQKAQPTMPRTKGRIVVPKANVRLGPNTQALKFIALEEGDTITILGKTVDWYHTQLPDNTFGFIHHSLITEVTDTKKLNTNYK
ncbi:peptidoglycan DD-metalloendopeptidase family protein [Zobellia laminariae]|uniref:M23 family metallopeptidase n=1 Tax=Zobellia laminariae TaxID=248906 RepID=UPI0012D9500F|nr:M23 family peptidase [Zobellia laminariae]